MAKAKTGKAVKVGGAGKGQGKGTFAKGTKANPNPQKFGTTLGGAGKGSSGTGGG